MKYWVDAYNLLFRTLRDDRDLHHLRQELISKLNEQVKYTRVQVTLIFDAVSQYGDAQRSNHDALDIVYTGEGITADEHIVDELSRHPHPQRITVVTSDRRLAWQCRNTGAKTVECKAFSSWLRKRSERRPLPAPPKLAPRKKVPEPPPVSKTAPPKDRPVESCYDFYLEVFSRGEPTSAPQTKIEESPAIDDHERWQQLFEKRLREKGDG